jgi:HlyD family secretion protein
MKRPPARTTSPRLPALLLAGALLLATPALAADDPAAGADAPRGPAVTVLKAAKAWFNNNVEVSGVVIAREETSVRPDRQGL